MASSSSSPRTWKYDVFTSFHGPDVRQTFLSHSRKQFKLNGIKMFDDTEIERSHIIGPTLTQAIRESRIYIVVLSKQYASSRWCLKELLEILKCNENGQRVMTVFHGVDPSDVRKQAGDFGIAFNETCASETDEEQQRKWSQALTYVADIAGEDFKNWDNEANMIEKIARDVSDKLINATPSNDFDDMVGLEAHLKKLESLLDLGNDGMVKIVGISGPAGIGKTTIARALHGRHSNSFPLSCFMDNQDRRGIYHNGSDEYSSKLRLQEKLLSKLRHLNGMTITHLGVIKNMLQNKKVFIILDDVERLYQLEALANIGWFGPGSRVIVTTENKEILQQHGIDDIYHVGFPSRSEALMIFCLSAFKQTSPPAGFMSLAYEVASICGDLPLGLHVLGSSLRGKCQADWIAKLPRLKSSLDGEIESVLKVGYESLHEKDQALFLFIAVFFNYNHVDHVISMLEESKLNVRYGMKVLADKHLIHIDGGPESKVVMHRLLQLMARQVISKQELWKRQILVDALDNAKDNGSIIGVSFDVAESNNVIINAKALKKMCNLFFLKVYNWWHRQEIQFHIPEDFEFPRGLRLLHWEAYPEKSLPLRFCTENLIELNMEGSLLEKLWEGTDQPLAKLKEMNLMESYRLTKLPDLSKATNLERLFVSDCTALLELPPSISNLHKLVNLALDDCKRVEVIPSLINLVSLQGIHMGGCSRLRNFPNIGITNRVLRNIDVSGCANLKTFLTDLPTSVEYLDLSESGVERITDCIKDLQNLLQLELSSCKRLVSLPELPSSLKYLRAENCESLERVSGPLITPDAELYFSNCFKLDREARQTIVQRYFATGFALLPGSEVPAEFNHRARGNFLTIPHTGFNNFKVCLVISPFRPHEYKFPKSLPGSILLGLPPIESREDLESEHLLIYQDSLPFIHALEFEESRKVVLDFGSLNFYIIECGVQILRDETDGSGNEEDSDNDLSDTYESDEASDEGEESEKEDDEEGYESESEEAFEEKDEDIGNDGDYESVSRKRTREMTSDESNEASDEEDYDSETTMIKNVRWGIQRLRL